MAAEGGRLEFNVEPASSGDEARVLAAVADPASATPHCDFREPERYGASPSRVSERAPVRRGTSDPAKGAVTVVEGAK